MSPRLLVLAVLCLFGVSTASSEPKHDPAESLAALKAAEGLEVSLFASEPMLVNPSSLDVDHLGRVWICEIVNYRPDRNPDNPVREEGDRILVLEDTDGDGAADRRTVFYQGRDIDSPHGVLVLGDRVIVSANGKILSLIDDDGDLEADRKEVLFQGIGGAQSDHGIHPVTLGPDGRLYFNFGDAGKRLVGPDGGPVIDEAGNEVVSDRDPYQQGMIFRCELDGSGLETVAWNFRNPWEVTVDSFGGIWQTDNDDDGNRAVRVNFVMEFGNYGRRDEITGAAWKTPRTGWHPEIASRHWHQNDPGVVPNLLITGAGSPVGLCVYEGSLLPERFRGELIHCEAGPNVVRAYPVERVGAGFRASMDPLVTDRGDRWFRPTDVSVAPDGSLYVTDWYDAGVGGHRMWEATRGRIYRITSAEKPDPAAPAIDLSSSRGAAEALRSPNSATRFLAWEKLRELGDEAEPALLELWDEDDPRWRARALWLLAMLPDGDEFLAEAARSDAEELRVTAIRAARRVDRADATFLSPLAEDESPAVRREVAIALREVDSTEAPGIWATLAERHAAGDRWYLEALGIGARGRWDACLDAWLARVGERWDDAAGREIVWRSRAGETPSRLARLIRNSDFEQPALPSLIRAFDFQSAEAREPVLRELVFGRELETARDFEIAAEALVRLPLEGEKLAEKERNVVANVIDRLAGTANFIPLVKRFDLRERADELLSLAVEAPESEEAVSAIQLLLDWDRLELLESVLRGDAETAVPLATAIGAAADLRAKELLQSIVEDPEIDPAVRKESVRSMGRRGVTGIMLVEMAREGKIDSTIEPVVVATLHASAYTDVRVEAAKVYPPTQSGAGRKLPPIWRLAEQRGDAEAGAAVFHGAGTCIVCHQVGGEGRDVGPALDLIGSKLTREGLYEAILFPSAGISHGFETWTVTLEDGTIHMGFLESETEDRVTVKGIDAISRPLDRATVVSMEKQDISLMPDTSAALTREQLVDLVEYLATLRGDEESSP